jgi:hypothetical protein
MLSTHPNYVRTNHRRRLCGARFIESRTALLKSSFYIHHHKANTISTHHASHRRDAYLSLFAFRLRSFGLDFFLRLE